MAVILPEVDVTLNEKEREELLRRIPAYRRGELSPAEAHKISMLLVEDKAFGSDAAREELFVSVLSSLPADPVPRGLVSRSVQAAVGESATASWFSLDTLLIALGVGVGCAGAAQFLTGKIQIVPLIGQWIGSLAGVVVDQSFGTVIGTIALASVGIVFGGVAWVVRLLRS